jgi:hypothetical protein
MPTISSFDPPANTPEFSETQLRAWSEFLGVEFDAAVRRTGGTQGANRSQFYNPAKESTDEPSIDEAHGTIFWQGFPKVIEREFGEGTDAAFQAAEPAQLPVAFNPFYQRTVPFRPHDEYLEWHVEKNAAGKITRVTFTCEPPELWEALAEGYPLLYRGPRSEAQAGERDKVLQLYRDLVSAEVQKIDLFPNNGPYDPWNIWNTSRGIVHLTHQSNTLGAEVNLAADGTVLRKDDDGAPITAEQALIRCSGFGARNRASDPHIGHVVNGLAAQGFSLTLRNPIGLYIDDLDTNGWTKPGPNGTQIATGKEFWRVVRGHDRLILRAVYQVPTGVAHPDTGAQLTVSDIQIGGLPIRFSGQIAKRISMKLIATGCRVGQSHKRRYFCSEDPSEQGVAPAITQPLGAAAEEGAPARVRLTREISD